MMAKMTWVQETVIATNTAGIAPSHGPMYGTMFIIPAVIPIIRA